MQEFALPYFRDRGALHLTGGEEELEQTTCCSLHPAASHSGTSCREVGDRSDKLPCHTFDKLKCWVKTVYLYLCMCIIYDYMCFTGVWHYPLLASLCTLPAGRVCQVRCWMQSGVQLVLSCSSCSTGWDCIFQLSKLINQKTVTRGGLADAVGRNRGSLSMLCALKQSWKSCWSSGDHYLLTLPPLVLCWGLRESAETGYRVTGSKSKWWFGASGVKSRSAYMLRNIFITQRISYLYTLSILLRKLIAALKKRMKEIENMSLWRHTIIIYALNSNEHIKPTLTLERHFPVRRMNFF